MGVCRTRGANEDGARTYLRGSSSAEEPPAVLGAVVARRTSRPWSYDSRFPSASFTKDRTRSGVRMALGSFFGRSPRCLKRCVRRSSETNPTPCLRSGTDSEAKKIVEAPRAPRRPEFRTIPRALSWQTTKFPSGQQVCGLPRVSRKREPSGETSDIDSGRHSGNTRKFGGSSGAGECLRSERTEFDSNRGSALRMGGRISLGSGGAGRSGRVRSAPQKFAMGDLSRWSARCGSGSGRTTTRSYF